MSTPIDKAIRYIASAQQALREGDYGLVLSRIRQIEALKSTYQLDNIALDELVEHLQRQIPGEIQS